VWIYRADTLHSSDDWIDLDQDTTKWRAVVSTVLKVIFQKQAKFLAKMRKYVHRILPFLSLR
jgi:hypothetical protein